MKRFNVISILGGIFFFLFSFSAFSQQVHQCGFDCEIDCPYKYEPQQKYPVIDGINIVGVYFIPNHFHSGPYADIVEKYQREVGYNIICPNCGYCANPKLLAGNHEAMIKYYEDNRIIPKLK